MGAGGSLRRFASLLLLFAPLSLAQDSLSQEELRGLLRVKIRTVQHMALNPIVIRAARAQNASGLDMAEIEKRDAEWRASKEMTPLKIALQGTPAGRFLRDTVRRLDSVNEAFLTDDKGANVAAYPPTSDYRRRSPHR
jgi:hypothetical protein